MQSKQSFKNCGTLTFSDFLNSKEDGEKSPTIDTKDPLNKALCMLIFFFFSSPEPLRSQGELIGWP